jgi:hypothetical protein
MVRRIAISGVLCLLVMCAAPVQADPIHFDISTCAQGDCAAYQQSGGGSVDALLEVVNGTDLLITLTNRLNSSATNDDPFLTNLGFTYSGVLAGLTFDSFTVLNGIVYTPTFSVDTTVRTFFLDFGFLFSQVSNGTHGAGRFQSGDSVRILVGTSGLVDADEFTMGVAKLAGAGTDGRSGGIMLTGTATASVPEPGTLLAMAMGLGVAAIRRRRFVAA